MANSPRDAAKLKSPYNGYRYFAGRNKTRREDFDKEFQEPDELDRIDAAYETAHRKWLEGIASGNGREATREYREFLERGIQ